MKKLTLLFVIFLILMNLTNLCAQDWAPPGSTWHYSFNNFSVEGYIEIKYIRDSLIFNKNCKVLEKIKYIYDSVLGYYDTINLGLEFTYLDSNKVYYYKYDTFFILYNFNAQPGDWWITASGSGSSPLFGSCDSTGIVQVDSICTMVINSDTLRCLNVSRKDTSDWAFEWVSPVKIVEKIGCLGYMFPEPFYCVIDIYEGGPLRCYEDSIFGIYQTGISSSCDYIITSTGEVENYSKDIFLYPNPAKDYISIILPEEVQANSMVVYNSIGCEIYQSELNKNNSILNLSMLSAGLYNIKIITNNNIFIKKILIIK